VFASLVQGNIASMIKREIDSLFSVGDVLTCCHTDETFRVSAILDDRVQLASTKDSGDVFSFHYHSIDEAIKHFKPDEIVNDFSLLACFISEYFQRADQAHRDAEVDAMWRSAVACQL
jgi:hypothetical protein